MRKVFLYFMRKMLIDNNLCLIIHHSGDYWKIYYDICRKITDKCCMFVQ